MNNSISTSVNTGHIVSVVFLPIIITYIYLYFLNYNDNIQLLSPNSSPVLYYVSTLLFLFAFFLYVTGYGNKQQGMLVGIALFLLGTIIFFRSVYRESNRAIVYNVKLFSVIMLIFAFVNFNTPNVFVVSSLLYVLGIMVLRMYYML